MFDCTAKLFSSKMTVIALNIYTDVVLVSMSMEFTMFVQNVCPQHASVLLNVVHHWLIE